MGGSDTIAKEGSKAVAQCSAAAKDGRCQVLLRDCYAAWTAHCISVAS